jgi:hypothetical protein
MKNDHEKRISQRLDAASISDVNELKDQIAICLAENHEAWRQYGPMSENARKNPHSDEMYAIWLSERLSTIVPNNRIVVGLLEKHRNLLGRSVQRIVSQFLLHANSYERWVNDEIPYQAVLRFPLEFEALISSD